MKNSVKADKILAQMGSNTKLGDLRKLAKEIEKNHALAMELWATELFLPRQLAILIMDNKLLDNTIIHGLTGDMYIHPATERNQLMDWLMANQLTKDKKNIAVMQSWADSPFSLQRRTYWYYQARLRWTGQTAPANTADLLAAIEKNIVDEEPEVQWVMNFTVGWIGVYEKKYRDRCIQLGVKIGLYKGDMVSKGCTPNYLPEFIAMESKKRRL